jgi:hypothetical protein
MEKTVKRWVGYGGLVFVALVVLATLVAPEPPSSNATAADVISVYHQDRFAYYAKAYLIVIAVIVGLTYCWYLRGHLARVPANRRLLTVAYAGAIMFAVSATVGAGMTLALVDASRAGNIAGNSMQTLNLLQSHVSIPTAAAGTATFLIVTGLLIVRNGVLPRWLGWMAFVFGVIAITGPLAPVGIGLWILLVSITTLAGVEPTTGPPRRGAGVVERLDVADDGRGRAYRLRPAGFEDLAGWIRSTSWSAELAAASKQPQTRRLLARIGGFLDAFARRDVAFFERHLRDDAVLIFPRATEPLGKADCIQSVSEHPPYQRHQILAEPKVQLIGSATTVVTFHAEISTAGQPRCRHTFVTAVMEERDPWQLAHLQWTEAGSTTRRKGTMTDVFDLTATYVVVSGDTATTFEGGEAFWKRLAAQDPALSAADGGWLVSSYTLSESWPKWEMHPNGDEIVSCRSGRCSFKMETPAGTQNVELTAGRTVLIPRGIWHTATVDSQAELLHITYGSGTTFKPAISDPLPA